MDILKQNLLLLSKNSENLKYIKQLESTKLSTASDYTISFNKNNLHTVSYKSKLLVSNYAPDVESKKLVDSTINNNTYSMGLFFSASSLHQVEYFLSLSNSKKAIIIEHDIEIIFSLLSNVYFSFLDRVIFIANESVADIILFLDKIIKDTDIINTIVIRHARASAIYFNYYDELTIAYNILAREKIMSLTSYFYFSKLWANNILYNKKFNQGFSINCFKNLLDNNTPLLLVSGGASLDESLEEIKKLSKKYFILCLSHAFNTLIKNDILPDAVITTDGGFYSYIHFEEFIRSKKDIKIFTTHTAYPTPLNHIKNENIFYFTHDESLENLIYKNSDYIPMEGSVIMPAFRIALMLKPSHIILSGVDFCYIDEKTHTKYSSSFHIDYTTHNKLATIYTKNYNRQNAECEINCYDNQKRKTSYALSSYHKHVESFINSVNNIKFYNLSKKSAIIKNIEIYKNSISEKSNDKLINIKPEMETSDMSEFLMLFNNLKSALAKNDEQLLLENKLFGIVFPSHKLSFSRGNIDFHTLKVNIFNWINYINTLNIS